MTFKHKDNTVKKVLYSKKIDPHKPLIELKGKGYSKYREQWVKTGKFLMETNYPTQIDFELNPSCNLKCPMCTWSAEKTFGQGSKYWMPFEKYKKIINEISNKVKSVSLNNVNEPLIRKDIVDFVKYASDQGIYEVMFNTNGLLLTKEMSKKLIHAGLTKLSVSLDAHTKKVYDKIRIGSDFRKVIQNIKDFLEIRKQLKSDLPLLKLTFLTVTLNKHELKPFLNYWEKKADLISIQNPSNPFDGDIGEEKRKWLGIKKEFEKKVNNENENEKVSYDYDFDNLKRCAQPNQRMVIVSNGTVNPCCNFRGVNIKVGNAFKQSVHTLWNNKVYKGLRSMHKMGKYKNHKVCKSCIDQGSKETPKV